jgi:alpha-D-ribose 1-methylphosphonate 5-phosphate C-P lyase
MDKALQTSHDHITKCSPENHVLYQNAAPEPVRLLEQRNSDNQHTAATCSGIHFCS